MRFSLNLVSEVRIMSKIKFLRETIAEDRARVSKMLDEAFHVPGFPLKVLKGRLNSIVAPSHSGKTIYSIGLAVELARTGRKVMYLGTEEDKDSFIAKTMNMDLEEEVWDNLAYWFEGQFDANKLELFIKAIEELGIEFLVVDYIKKSMWNHYNSDHVVMEEINSTLLKANAGLENKLGIFTFVQGNRTAFDAKRSNLDELVKDSGQVALMIDGGMPVYRSADNLLFIKKEKGTRSFIVAKSRYEPDELGNVYDYDVDLDTFHITMYEKKTVFNDKPKPKPGKLKGFK